MGFEYQADRSFPLSGLSGDLWSLGEARARFGLSSNVELVASWTAQHFLSVGSRAPSAVPLTVEPGEGSRDFGDVSLGVVLRVLGQQGWRPALGLSFETRLPTTNEGRGIGTNTTDFFSSVIAARRLGRWSLLADVGVGILEAPAEVGEQNDVLVYDLSVTVALSQRARSFLVLDGQASTRRRIPVGTEDWATLQWGGDYAFGPVRLDGAVVWGLHGRDADWGLTVGASWLLRGRDEG